MEILEKTPYANKFYAKIQTEDGGILELSSPIELTDEQWEQLYNDFKQKEEEILLEAEDGEEV